MGVSASKSVAKLTQIQANSLYQTSNNTCTATCTQLQQGNVVVLDNTTAGDITFTQKCSANASCYMNTSLDILVEAYQNAVATAEARPALFPGVQLNSSKSDITQVIKNEVSQVFNNLCQADVNQVLQDNIVYATDSSVGNIGFLQEGNASADCVMINVAVAKLNLDQVGKATASAGTINSAIIAAIIIAICIMFIVIALISANKGKSKSQPSAPPSGGGSFGPSSISALKFGPSQQAALKSALAKLNK